MKTDKKESKRVGHTVMRINSKKTALKGETKKALRKSSREDGFEKKEFLRDE